MTASTEPPPRSDISTIEAARLLNVAERHVRRMVDRGDLRLSFRLGGYVNSPLVHNLQEVQALAARRALGFRPGQAPTLYDDTPEETAPHD